ncbi:hypothetical protein T10_10690 [Trichinella papuae]|uniref:Uncharacterized protein n=1 Tax=Trichinella papuae TaxID=268474 RepID=A0A0V1LWV6_9BILA|nr:hypothetical protein T10_10690 [Trichinella papuae]
MDRCSIYDAICKLGLLAAGFIRQDLPFKNCNVANILQALFQNLISVAALNSMC